MLTTGRNTLFFHSLCQLFFLLDPVLQISVWRSAQFGFPGRVSDSAAHIGCLSCQISMTSSRLPCHCEERSDVAISWYNAGQ